MSIDYPPEEKRTCDWCYPREQGTHGEVKREWLKEWNGFSNLCRLHSVEEREKVQSGNLANDQSVMTVRRKVGRWDS